MPVTKLNNKAKLFKTSFAQGTFIVIINFGLLSLSRYGPKNGHAFTHNPLVSFIHCNSF